MNINYLIKSQKKKRRIPLKYFSFHHTFFSLCSSRIFYFIFPAHFFLSFFMSITYTTWYLLPPSHPQTIFFFTYTFSLSSILLYSLSCNLFFVKICQRWPWTTRKISVHYLSTCIPTKNHTFRMWGSYISSYFSIISYICLA